MSESKHTPGPWTIGTFHNGDSVTRQCIQPVDGPGWVCDMDEGKGTTVEGEANARLIAAAPDLLEALRGLINLATHPQVTKSETKMFAKECRAAIAKAEGGAG